MIRECEKCHASYNDATCWTICPHERFISDSDAQRKDRAFSLCGKLIRVLEGNHRGEVCRVRSIDSLGYVTVDITEETFAPYQFEVMPE